MSSFLDEAIEAVAAGLSTAVYQRPLTPRTTTRKKRKGGNSVTIMHLVAFSREACHVFPSPCLSWKVELEERA